MELSAVCISWQDRLVESEERGDPPPRLDGAGAELQARGSLEKDVVCFLSLHCGAGTAVHLAQALAVWEVSPEQPAKRGSLHDSETLSLGVAQASSPLLPALLLLPQLSPQGRPLGAPHPLPPLI